MVTASGTGLWQSGQAGEGRNVYFVMYTIFDAAPRAEARNGHDGEGNRKVRRFFATCICRIIKIPFAQYRIMKLGGRVGQLGCVCVCTHGVGRVRNFDLFWRRCRRISEKGKHVQFEGYCLTFYAFLCFFSHMHRIGGKPDYVRNTCEDINN